MDVLYRLYELQHAALMPWRMMGEMTKSVLTNPLVPAGWTHMARSLVAGIDVADHAIRQRGKPDWAIMPVERGSKAYEVREEVVSSRPFLDLTRFRRIGLTANDPKILLVAPMSGHYATLLRGTVQALARDHDVYVTDWRDARLVPLSEGEFGVDEYIGELMLAIRRLGPDVNVMAVCQPAPLVLAAVSLLAAQDDSAQPRTMILMGGPVDTEAAPTQPTRLAMSRPLEWFERSVVTEVPGYYPGAGRQVYPGFLQLGGFISMNASRHFDAHLSMFHHLVRGDGESAEAQRAFYDEYLSVMDIPAGFYLDTIDRIFQRHLLPLGEMTWRGVRVDPGAIRKTALLTVEGELDDISAPGQTIAAHGLCRNLPRDMQEDYLQRGVGHYGIFNGRRWREEICPRISAFVRRHAAD